MYDTSHRYQSQLQVLPAQSIPSPSPARFPTIASLLSSSTPAPIPSLASISTPKLGPVSVSLLHPTTTANPSNTPSPSPSHSASALTSSFSKTSLSLSASPPSTSPMNLNNLNNLSTLNTINNLSNLSNLNNLGGISSLNTLNRSASPATSAEINDKDASMSPQSHPHAIGAGDSPTDGSNKNRALSTSKRAEQNRRAQRAFRERRDARVKHLEARAALLEETIAQADEANRRWEECRALVDRLRHENAMLRTALEQAGISVNGISSSGSNSNPRPQSHSHSHSHSQSHSHSHSQSNSSTNHSNGVESSTFTNRGGNLRDREGDIHSTLQDATAINGSGDGHNKKRKRREADDDLRQ